MVAASPEHLSLADDLEVRGWMITTRETELLDATPAVTSNTFLDIRRKDVPSLEGFEETHEEVDEDEKQQQQMQLQRVPEETPLPNEEIKIPDFEESEAYTPSEGPDAHMKEQEAESPASKEKREEFELGMKRSETARRRMARSSVFFKAKGDERKLKKTLSLKSVPYTEKCKDFRDG